MNIHEEYKRLYEIQDSVMDVVRSVESVFYLTGGTCLHRFYFGKRYSDDLDFFTSDNALYRENIRTITEVLQERLTVHVAVDTRDFVRMIVGESLQVDFVNDRVYRHGANRRTDSGVSTDNPENIAANKICAIIGRDEPKDIFDLCTLLTLGDLDVPSVVEAAEKKCVFDRELLELRMQSFPLALLDRLAVIDTGFLERLKAEYSTIIQPLSKW